MTALRPRRGANPFGCLLALLVFGLTLHYGLAVGRVYYRYARFESVMQTSARLAAARTDLAIRDSLRSAAIRLGLPKSAQRVWVRRSSFPPRIRIETRYVERITFPLGKVVDIPFNVKAEAYF